MKLFPLLLLLSLNACITAAPRSQEPSAQFKTGYTFNMPCDEHGKHVQTITAVELMQVYTVESDLGDKVQLSETTLLQILKNLGLEVSTDTSHGRCSSLIR